MPALPGHMLIFAGLLVGAWAEGFTRVGVWTLVVLGLIALASYGVDFVAVALGAKRLGASPRAMTGAALGTLAGLFFGLPGVIVGPVRWRRHRRADDASRLRARPERLAWPPGLDSRSARPSRSPWHS